MLIDCSCSFRSSMLAIYHILAKSRLCWVHRDEDHENSDERHCEYSDVEMNDAKPLENFERCSLYLVPFR